MTDRMSRRTFVKAAGVGAAALAVGDGLLHPQALHAEQLAHTVGAPSAQMPALDPQMQAVINELMTLEAPMITDMTPFNARQTSPLTLAVQAVLTQQGTAVGAGVQHCSPLDSGGVPGSNC